MSEIDRCAFIVDSAKNQVKLESTGRLILKHNLLTEGLSGFKLNNQLVSYANKPNLEADI